MRTLSRQSYRFAANSPLKAKGFEPSERNYAVDPEEEKPVHSCAVRDPQGNLLSLVARPYQAGPNTENIGQRFERKAPNTEAANFLLLCEARGYPPFGGSGGK